MLKQLIHSRECLTPDAFYEAFYKESGIDKELVIELMEHVALELELPAGKLRPGDRLSVELAPERGNEFDSGRAILMYELGALVKQHGLALQGKVDTLDDYLKTMALVSSSDGESARQTLSGIRRVLIAFIAGIIPPTLLLSVQYLSPSLMTGFMRLPLAGDVVLALWPSSIILMGSDERSDALIPIVAVALNGVAYGFLFLTIQWLANRLRLRLQA